VKTLMRRMGIGALYRRPRTTKPFYFWLADFFSVFVRTGA